MRTPEEIKKGLEICRGKCTGNKPHCPYDKYVNGCEDALNRDALAYIQKLEAQQPRWISVGERLPEDADRVYVALRGGAGGVYIAQYFENKCQPQADYWILDNDWEGPASPTHWMPLPQPPEEG